MSRGKRFGRGRLSAECVIAMLVAFQTELPAATRPGPVATRPGPVATVTAS